MKIDRTDSESSTYAKKVKIFEGHDTEGALKWREDFDTLQKNLHLTTATSSFKVARATLGRNEVGTTG